jgi:hypothetical protein
MSDNEPEGRLRTDQERSFQDAQRLPKEINEKNKQAALDACTAEHADLLQCYMDRKPYWECHELSKTFWACYTKNRGFGRTVVASWLSKPLEMFESRNKAENTDEDT